MNTQILKYTIPYEYLPSNSYDCICSPEPHESGDIIIKDYMEWLILGCGYFISKDNQPLLIYPEGYYVTTINMKYVSIFHSHQGNLDKKYNNIKMISHYFNGFEEIYNYYVKENNMVYQGSKNKLAKFLVPIIQKYIDDNNVNTYIELFVGGANLIDKISCKRRIGSDYNENVITLLKYVQKDNNLSIAPSECTFEHYSDVRANQNTGKYSKEYVALIGYCASYGGRYFDGGYGRDSKGGRTIYTERIKNLKKQAPSLKNIEFYCNDYKNFKYERFNNCVIYLDPPYNNTKKYAKQCIDYNEFYDFCEKLAKNNIVLISEYNMPSDRFECIWKKEVKVLQKSDRTKGDKAIEKLFICKRRKIK